MPQGFTVLDQTGDFYIDDGGYMHSSGECKLEIAFSTQMRAFSFKFVSIEACEDFYAQFGVVSDTEHVLEFDYFGFLSSITAELLRPHISSDGINVLIQIYASKGTLRLYVNSLLISEHQCPVHSCFLRFKFSECVVSTSIIKTPSECAVFPKIHPNFNMDIHESYVSLFDVIPCTEKKNRVVYIGEDLELPHPDLKYYFEVVKGDFFDTDFTHFTIGFTTGDQREPYDYSFLVLQDRIVKGKTRYKVESTDFGSVYGIGVKRDNSLVVTIDGNYVKSKSPVLVTHDRLSPFIEYKNGPLPFKINIGQFPFQCRNVCVRGWGLPSIEEIRYTNCTSPSTYHMLGLMSTSSFIDSASYLHVLAEGVNKCEISCVDHRVSFKMIKASVIYESYMVEIGQNVVLTLSEDHTSIQVEGIAGGTKTFSSHDGRIAIVLPIGEMFYLNYGQIPFKDSYNDEGPIELVNGTFVETETSSMFHYGDILESRDLLLRGKCCGYYKGHLMIIPSGMKKAMPYECKDMQTLSASLRVVHTERKNVTSIVMTKTGAERMMLVPEYPARIAAFNHQIGVLVGITIDGSFIFRPVENMYNNSFHFKLKQPTLNPIIRCIFTGPYLLFDVVVFEKKIGLYLGKTEKMYVIWDGERIVITRSPLITIVRPNGIGFRFRYGNMGRAIGGTLFTSFLPTHNLTNDISDRNIVLCTERIIGKSIPGALEMLLETYGKYLSRR